MGEASEALRAFYEGQQTQPEDHLERMRSRPAPCEMPTRTVISISHLALEADEYGSAAGMQLPVHPSMPDVVTADVNEKYL